MTMEIIINNRYRIDGQIGSGGCGTVCLGTDLQHHTSVAIKLEADEGFQSLLGDEDRIYEKLAGGTGIARVYHHGVEGAYHVMVYDLLGPTLQDLFNFCGRNFSLKTILLLADQLIARMAFVHSRFIVHRDIKPHNFLMGFGEQQGNTVYATDFGMAKEFRVDKFRDRRSFCGTERYASISSHLGFEQSPKDDLESLAYMLIYFARGSLPWQGLEYASTDEYRNRIGAKKISLSPEQLCQGLPKEFAMHLRYVRSLTYRDKPDHTKLRELYARLFRRQGFVDDGVFDWTGRESVRELSPEPVQERIPSWKGHDAPTGETPAPAEEPPADEPISRRLRNRALIRRPKP